MISSYLNQLARGQTLSAKQMTALLHHVVAGIETAQLGALIALLGTRSPTADELEGVVREMRANMVRVLVKRPAIDIVGTGGDGAHTVNISTAAALVVAAGGVAVAKHGNRAASSRCGSANFIEALGIPIEQTPEQVTDFIDRIGIGFLFAPTYHPAMREVQKARRSLGLRSLFNLVGPLTNPASVDYQLLGVGRKEDLPVVAEVVRRLGTKATLVFHGSGLDEISPIGPAEGVFIQGHKSRPYSIDPQQLGCAPCTVDELCGGEAATNRRLIMAAYSGEEGPIFDAIALNAAAAFFLVDVVPNLESGMELARSLLRRKKVITLVEQWKSIT